MSTRHFQYTTINESTNIGEMALLVQDSTAIEKHKEQAKRTKREGLHKRIVKIPILKNGKIDPSLLPGGLGGSTGASTAPQITMGKSITVTNPIGGLSSGFVINTSMDLWSVIQRMVNPTTTPTYQAPTISISADVTSGEVGSLPNIIVTPTWQQRDAGLATNYRINLNGSQIHTNSTPLVYTIPGFQFTDAVKQLQAQVTFQAGPVKNDSENNPYPTGQIQAGAVNSNIIQMTGHRLVFFECFDEQVTTPDTSDEIRSFINTLNNVASTKQIIINIPGGTQDVIFAFPETFGGAIDVRQQGFEMVDMSVAFVKTTVEVEGANGYVAVPYSVYHMTNASPFPEDIRYTITIL
jgi:hypothetical protein